MRNSFHVSDPAIVSIIGLNYTSLSGSLSLFQDYYNTPKNAKRIVEDCIGLTRDIEENLGNNHEVYIDYCSALVENALEMTIISVNLLHEQIDAPDKQLLNFILDMSHVRSDAFSSRGKSGENSYKAFPGSSRENRINNYIHIVEDAINTVNYLSSLDININSIIRSELNKNAQIFNNILDQNRKSNNGGCYIATMVYGDYNHPKVLILRNFRDEVLQKQLIGKAFVNFYYYASPFIVTLFHKKKRINNYIRYILDIITELKHIKFPHK